MTSAPARPKTCGSCSLCCKVFRIEALKKPSGEWCPNCAIGRGCKIYGSHPKECQDFVCQWLKFEQMPDSFRPDRTKVVLAIEPPGEQLIARCDPASPMAWRKEPIYSFLKRYAQGAMGASPDLRVYAVAGDRLWLITPNEDVDFGRVEGGVPFNLAKGADGKLKPVFDPPQPASRPAGDGG